VKQTGFCKTLLQGMDGALSIHPVIPAHYHIVLSLPLIHFINFEDQLFLLYLYILFYVFCKKHSV
jgi:hypothetical protein